MPIFGPPNIERLAEQGNLRGLIKALGYERDPDIQHQAAEALGRLGSEQAVSPLRRIAASDSVEAPVRGAAIAALGRIGGHDAAEALSDLVERPTLAPRWIGLSLRSLGQTGGEETTIKTLIAALDSSHESVREAAVEGLASVGPPALHALADLYNDGKGAKAPIALEILQRMGQPLVLHLTQQLREGDPQERSRAAKLLGVLGAEEAVPALIEAMGSASMSCRYTAARSLEQIGEPAVPLLAEALRGDNRTLYRMAIDSLGNIGGPAAGDALIQVLKQGNRTFRREAAKALAECAQECHIKDLLAVYPESDWNTQRQLAAALSRIGDKRATNVLVDSLTAPDQTLRESAMLALRKLHWKPEEDGARAAYLANRGSWEECAALGAAAIPPLVRLLPGTAPEEQEQIIETLASLGSEAQEALREQLGEGDSDARAISAKALGVLGDASVVPALQRACDDESARVRAEALTALGTIGDAEALPTLLKGLEDGNSQARHAAAQALGALGGPALPHLIERLEEQGPNQLLIEALGESQHRDAVAPLIAALRETEGVLEARTRSALSRIGEPAVPQLADCLADADSPTDLRKATVDVLARIGTPEALAALVTMLWNENATLAEAAAERLERLQDVRDLPQPPEELAGVHIMLIADQPLSPEDAQRDTARVLDRLSARRRAYRDLNVALSADFSLLRRYERVVEKDVVFEELLADFCQRLDRSAAPENLVQITLPPTGDRGAVHALVWYEPLD